MRFFIFCHSFTLFLLICIHGEYSQKNSDVYIESDMDYINMDDTNDVKPRSINTTNIWNDYYDNDLNVYISYDNDGNKVYNSECFDLHDKCTLWSLNNECNINPGYMHQKCALSCNTCHKQSYSFRNEYCVNKWSNMYGNDEMDCYVWKRDGYCDNIEHKSWMYVNCQKACNVCDYERRCNPNKYYKSAYNFENITNMDLYNTIFYQRILSNKHLTWKYGAKLLSLNPPILYFDHFIPETISDQFIQETSNLTYKRSVDIGMSQYYFINIQYRLNIISNSIHI